MLILRQARLQRRQFRRLLLPRPSERRIVLHVGAHKTGTTYIQKTLEVNRARLPLRFEMVPRRQRHLHQLTERTAQIRTEADFQRAKAELIAIARGLGQRFDRVENLLVSHEDLCGSMPGSPRFPGLYPMAHRIIPAIIEGLQASGAEVSVVFYRRGFVDWQASIYRYRFLDKPKRGYHPARFAKRTGLPNSWREFCEQLQAALPAGLLQLASYQQDRDTGLLGRALYQTLGLTTVQISALRRPPPQNVSRLETKHDTQFAP